MNDNSDPSTNIVLDEDEKVVDAVLEHGEFKSVETLTRLSRKPITTYVKESNSIKNKAYAKAKF